VLVGFVEEKVTAIFAVVPVETGSQNTRAYIAPKLPSVPMFAETPPMVHALGVDDASSVPTRTQTIRSVAAVPIETPL